MLERVVFHICPDRALRVVTRAFPLFAVPVRNEPFHQPRPLTKACPQGPLVRIPQLIDGLARDYHSIWGGGFPVKRRWLVQRQETNACRCPIRRRLDSGQRCRLQVDS